MTSPSNKDEIRAASLKLFDQRIIETYAEEQGLNFSAALRKIIRQWNEYFFFLDEEVDYDSVPNRPTGA